MTKHTVGPFRVATFGEGDGRPTFVRDNNGDWIITSPAGRVGTACFMDDDVPRRKRYGHEDPEGLANARLFAASPTMLAALKAAEDQLSRWPYTSEVVRGLKHPNTLIQEIRAAIALSEPTSDREG